MSVIVSKSSLTVYSVDERVASSLPGVGNPRLAILSCFQTIHSESSVFVPAEAVQSVLPCDVPNLRSKVWSLVAPVTPATSHSSCTPCMPMISINTSSLNNPKASSPLKFAIVLSLMSVSSCIPCIAEPCETT